MREEEDRDSSAFHRKRRQWYLTLQSGDGAHYIDNDWVYHGTIDAVDDSWIYLDGYKFDRHTGKANPGDGGLQPMLFYPSSSAIERYLRHESMRRIIPEIERMVENGILDEMSYEFIHDTWKALNDRRVGFSVEIAKPRERPGASLGNAGPSWPDRHS